jgi:hypothetical protein
MINQVEGMSAKRLKLIPRKQDCSLDFKFHCSDDFMLIVVAA